MSAPVSHSLEVNGEPTLTVETDAQGAWIVQHGADPDTDPGHAHVAWADLPYLIDFLEQARRAAPPPDPTPEERQARALEAAKAHLEEARGWLDRGLPVWGKVKGIGPRQADSVGLLYGRPALRQAGKGMGFLQIEGDLWCGEREG